MGRVHDWWGNRNVTNLIRPDINLVKRWLSLGSDGRVKRRYQISRPKGLPALSARATTDWYEGITASFAMKLINYRAVPRIFCLRGQTPQTFTGISRIQTGFLVKHYVRKKNSFPGGGKCPPCPLPLPPLPVSAHIWARFLYSYLFRPSIIM